MTRTAAYIATIPANSVGEQTLATIRKLVRTTGFKIVRRGRNPDRKGLVGKDGLNYWQTKNYVNVPHATRFDLYLHPSSSRYVPDSEYNTYKHLLKAMLLSIHNLDLEIVV